MAQIDISIKPMEPETQNSARGTKIAKTNAKVSEGYDEHQSSIY